MAKITLVQYGDYQCSVCQSVYSTIQSIQTQLGDQIRFVFRHFPQSQIHPEAYRAAAAAEAAASQHKFWEMHAHLMARQSQLADFHLVEAAIALYLDVDQFLQAMAADCHVAKVQADIASGSQSGVIQTPTFFINGAKYSNNHNWESLREVVVQANDA